MNAVLSVPVHWILDLHGNFRSYGICLSQVTQIVKNILHQTLHRLKDINK